jgi:hypothetical protein
MRDRGGWVTGGSTLHVLEPGGVKGRSDPACARRLAVDRWSLSAAGPSGLPRCRSPRSRGANRRPRPTPSPRGSHHASRNPPFVRTCLSFWPYHRRGPAAYVLRHVDGPLALYTAGGSYTALGRGGVHRRAWVLAVGGNRRNGRLGREAGRTLRAARRCSVCSKSFSVDGGSS